MIYAFVNCNVYKSYTHPKAWKSLEEITGAIVHSLTFCILIIVFLIWLLYSELQPSKILVALIHEYGVYSSFPPQNKYL